MCCRVLPIESATFKKPRCTLCQQCTEGSGCGIYDTRPEICRGYRCGWLGHDWLPDSFRPDQCGVIVDGTRDGSVVLLVCDAAMFESDPQRYGQLGQLLETILSRLGEVPVIIVPDARTPVVDVTFVLPRGMTQEQAMERVVEDKLRWCGLSADA
jgi:hypothetical protein